MPSNYLFKLDLSKVILQRGLSLLPPGIVGWRESAALPERMGGAAN
jgi:hypothetical protein